MPQCEVLKDWSVAELKRELLVWHGIELRTTQFYAWLSGAVIKPRKNGVYSERDKRKLMKFAEFMGRYNRIAIAKEKLLEHIKQYPEEYPNGE